MDNIEVGIPNQELLEAVNHSKTTSALYLNLVKAQRAENPRWAIIGPHFLPNEATSLAISYALGPDGILYSVDPQGDSTIRNSNFVTSNAFSVGGSAFLKKQLAEFRDHGLPLSKFEWLGTRSHFGFIPEEASELDGLADHSGIEFLESAVENPKYLVDGVQSQISAIKMGGIYVYQSEEPQKLERIFGMPYEKWLSLQGLSVIRHTLKTDSVKVDVTPAIVIWLKEHQSEANGYGKEASQLGRFLRGNKLIFTPSDDAIWYPSRHIFVGQKK